MDNVCVVDKARKIGAESRSIQKLKKSSGHEWLTNFMYINFQLFFLKRVQYVFVGYIFKAHWAAENGSGNKT
jgi:hypothetical protein